MVNEYLTKTDIITWIENWAKNNPNPTEADIATFAKNLNNKILKLDYKVTNGGTVIGYAGKLDDGGTGIFKTVENLTKNSNEAYCFINNAADNILNDDKFNIALNEAVGPKSARYILGGAWNGDTRSKYIFGDTLSF